MKNLITFCFSITLFSFTVNENIFAMNNFNDLPAYEANLARKYATMAIQGDAEAQYRIGILYADTETNKAEAVHWLELAANQGHVMAQEDLGWIYESGLGVEINDEQAIHWYKMAACNGHEGAKSRLQDKYGINL